MWPTTTRNRGKSGTPGRGNEIWERLRPLSFFSFAAPPHPRPGVAPAPTPYLRAVRAARPGRMARPAVPARGYRPSACSLRRPYGRPRDQKECAAVAIVRLAPGDSPPGFGRRGPGGCGGWWCAAGPVAGRRGLRRPVAAAPIARGRPPPAQVVGNKGPGLRGSAGRPPCGLWPFPRGGGLFSWPSGRPGGGGQPLALSGPSPALVNAGRAPPAARRPGWGRSARGPLWPGPGPPLRPRSSIAPGPQGGAGT